LPLEGRTTDARPFFPKDSLNPDEIRGRDIMMPEAVELKAIAASLSAEQLKEMIQIPPRRK
jgi:hypothetical protein